MKGGNYVIPDDQGWQTCVFLITTLCFYSYVLSNVTSQRKDIYGTTCCGDDCGIYLPECLLILYRSRIFAIETSIVNFQTCPR